jgi:hypothetical protein
MTNLNQDQLRALRWMQENPSNESEWLVDGKPIKRQPPEKWNQFRISGPAGSIVIKGADMKGLKGYFDSCPTPDKMYAPNEAGRSALAHALQQNSTGEV